jgi:hypothetical protein
MQSFPRARARALGLGLGLGVGKGGRRGAYGRGGGARGWRWWGRRAGRVGCCCIRCGAGAGGGEDGGVGGGSGEAAGRQLPCEGAGARGFSDDACRRGAEAQSGGAPLGRVGERRTCCCRGTWAGWRRTRRQAGDAISAARLLALTAQAQGELGRALAAERDAGERLPTLSLDADLSFAGPRQRAEFARALEAAVTAVIAAHAGSPVDAGESTEGTGEPTRYRLLVGVYPVAGAAREAEGTGAQGEEGTERRGRDGRGS